MTYHLSFCGCGLMVIYQVGVVECFITHGGRFLSRVDKLAGASAGALVAVAMATKLKEFHCLLASCHIPGYAGTTKPLHIRGKSYIDGGFTDNLPVFPTGRTITVSPFSGHQDISPTDRSVLGLRVRTVNQDFQFNLRNLHRGVRALVPPTKTGLERIYEQGWGDAVRFLKKEGLFDQ